METGACVYWLLCICSITSVYGLVRKPKCSKNEPQINNTGGETINEFNREMRIWEGYAVYIQEQAYYFVSNWSAHSKPIAQRVEIHTNGNQFKWLLKQREADLSICPCLCECMCACTHEGLRKIIAIDLRRRNVEMLPDGTFSCEWLRIRRVILQRPGQGDAANAHQNIQTFTQDEAKIHHQNLRYINACSWSF